MWTGVSCTTTNACGGRMGWELEQYLRDEFRGGGGVRVPRAGVLFAPRRAAARRPGFGLLVDVLLVLWPPQVRFGGVAVPPAPSRPSGQVGPVVPALEPRDPSAAGDLGIGIELVASSELGLLAGVARARFPQGISEEASGPLPASPPSAVLDPARAGS